MPFDASADPRREAIDRLLLVVDALENPVPEIDGYRQSVWCGKIKEEPECGTVACAIGHTLAKYKEIGPYRLRMDHNEDYGWAPTTDSYDTQSMMAETFGLTPEEFNAYFGGAGCVYGYKLDKDCNRIQPTRQRVADEIRALHARKVAELATVNP